MKRENHFTHSCCIFMCSIGARVTHNTSTYVKYPLNIEYTLTTMMLMMNESMYQKIFTASPLLVCKIFRIWYDSVRVDTSVYILTKGTLNEKSFGFKMKKKNSAHLDMDASACSKVFGGISRVVGRTESEPTLWNQNKRHKLYHFIIRQRILITKNSIFTFSLCAPLFHTNVSESLSHSHSLSLSFSVLFFLALRTYTSLEKNHDK